MSQYLVKYRDNWADEIDLEGIIILDEIEYKDFKKAVKKAYRFYFSVGSNQDIYYESTYDVENAYSITKITDKEADTFRKFGLDEMRIASKFVDIVFESAEENEGVIDFEEKIELERIKIKLKENSISLSDLKKINIWVYWEDEMFNSKVTVSDISGKELEVIDWIADNFEEAGYDGDLTHITNTELYHCFDENLLNYLEYRPEIEIFFCGEKVNFKTLKDSSSNKTYLIKMPE